MSGIDILQCELESRILGNRRTIWVQPGEAGVCVFLDGEYYLAHVRAAGIVRRLQQERVMPPMTVAYVSCVDHDVRWPESFCNDDFTSFLGDELLPWLAGSGENAVVGLSLTGLYHEFAGGHGIASWRADLPDSLTALFAM